MICLHSVYNYLVCSVSLCFPYVFIYLIPNTRFHMVVSCTAFFLLFYFSIHFPFFLFFTIFLFRLIAFSSLWARLRENKQMGGLTEIEIYTIWKNKKDSCPSALSFLPRSRPQLWASWQRLQQWVSGVLAGGEWILSRPLSCVPAASPLLSSLRWL